MKIGTYIIDTSSVDYHVDNNQYYYINKEQEKKYVSKLQVASIVASCWDEDCIRTVVERQYRNHIAKKIIPIYDWIMFTLYGYGKTKEDALADLEEKYEDLMKLYEIYEKNKEKNKRKFMSKIKKFAFIYKDRTDSDLNHKDDIPDMEFIKFENCDLTFRELAIQQGVPSDARADEPIFGYVDEDRIVIFREIYLQGTKEMYMDFFKKYHKAIAKMYGLKNYALFFGKVKYEDVSIRDKGYLGSEFITNTYDYYIPCDYQGRYEKFQDTYIKK